MSGSRLAELRYCMRHPWARLGVLVSALLILAVIGLGVSWWPNNAQRARLEDSITAERGRIARLRSDLELLKAYVAAKTGMQVVEQKLEYAATQAQQVSDVAQLARKQGITILSQAYETDARSKDQPALNTELVVQGSYRSLRNFIARVPDLPSFTEVNEVVFERAREANIVKGRIRLVTYRRAGTRPQAS